MDISAMLSGPPWSSLQSPELYFNNKLFKDELRKNMLFIMK